MAEILGQCLLDGQADRRGQGGMQMAERKQPHLVKLDAKPERTRRSVYSDLVEQFASDPDMKYARVEGATSTALPSVKKAIAKLGSKNIVAYTANGALILEKK
jgi:hypothetical protein